MDTSIDACMSCHVQVTGRPNKFPQIETFARHMQDQKLAFDPAAQCVDCHAPHSPE
jgi:ferredoxin